VAEDLELGPQAVAEREHRHPGGPSVPEAESWRTSICIEQWTVPHLHTRKHRTLDILGEMTFFF
jgi:hypothetical protein